MVLAIPQDITDNPGPATHVLSKDNLDNIVKYLKKQGNDHLVGSLIASLEVSLKNEYCRETDASTHDDYHLKSTHHHSLALKGSSKWEADEHNDDEVKVHLPDLGEIKSSNRRERERQLEIMEVALGRERGVDYRGKELPKDRLDKLINLCGLSSYRDHTGQEHAYKIAKNIANIIHGVSYFETGEHDDEEVTVLGETSQNNNLLTLPNGIKLTYGEIIGLAGDFYGVPGWPICEETSGTSYETRFMDAFNTLGRGDVTTIRKELHQIKLIMKIEKNSVATVLGQGDPSITTVLEKDKTYNQPSDVYKYHGLWFTIQYDTILGGYWVKGIPVKFGRMMKLAENNPDHFQPYSRKVWEVGHKIALQKAEEAKLVYYAWREVGVEMLQEAYAISAFSCHFLTDSFAAGHIRVPRVELPAVVTPAKAGNLLVHFQHDEDGKFGINVINEDQQRWRCFGDGTLYDEKSKENKRLVRGVVQECVDQVWQVFCDYPSNITLTTKYVNGYQAWEVSRSGPIGNVDRVLRKIPKVDSTRPNNFPLFTAASDNGKIKVFRRYDVDDLSDSRKTDDWWGWSTVAKLEMYDPKNSVFGLIYRFNCFLEKIVEFINKI